CFISCLFYNATWLLGLNYFGTRIYSIKYLKNSASPYTLNWRLKHLIFILFSKKYAPQLILFLLQII
ncbi:hypothetical protein ACJX0J_005869, partial [Zea mays]